MSTLVAIMCYNCAPQVQRVLKDLAHYNHQIDEVIVINNRSQDDTETMAQTQFKKSNFKLSKVLTNKQNYGLGGSHKVAFQYAIDNGHDYVIIQHGDHQVSPHELPKFFKLIQDPNIDIIWGARFIKDSKLIGYNKLRTLGNKALISLYSLVMRKKVYELGPGLALYSSEYLKNKSSFYHHPNTFHFNCYFLLEALTCSARIKYVPITWSETDQKSNVNTFKIGWLTLKALVLWRLGIRKVESQKSDDYNYDMTFQYPSDL